MIQRGLWMCGLMLAMLGAARPAIADATGTAPANSVPAQGADSASSDSTAAGQGQAGQSSGPAGTGQASDRPKVPKLPGVSINMKERYVDVDSRICLEEGLLELVACTKGTKEHESIVVVEAQAKHIHLALLLIGARAGHPPQWKYLKAQDRWVGIRAEGQAVDVFLVFKDEKGKTVEAPINEFIATEEGEHLPTHTFIFCGSQIHTDQQGKKSYLADVSGNVVSISSFGDETLCLPELVSQSNDQLTWRIDAEQLPKAGTKVALRLRPHLRPAKDGAAEPAGKSPERQGQ